MAGIFCFPLRKLFASSWTARRSSVVAVAVELACTGVAHIGQHTVGGEAIGAPCLASVGSGMAAGAVFAHPRAADPRVRPILFNHM